jgi:CRISPR-associated exonuclease Cas4
MPWAEADLVPVSALQHFVYCARQCALIHVEQTFDENIFTLRGRRVHERVERDERETEAGMRVEFALPLWSEQHGLIGKADAVWFRPDGTPYPVEHKVGERKSKECDDVQLCAQAICLEEMLARQVPAGAVYYHGSRRRREVAFDSGLRARTIAVVGLTRATLRASKLPPPVADGRCRSCSLLDACMPFAIRRFNEEEARAP